MKFYSESRKFQEVAGLVVGESIFSEVNDLNDLYQQVQDALRCYFDKGKVPTIISLYFFREEVLTS